MATNFATGLRPSSATGQLLPVQSIPRSAIPKNTTGKKAAGRFNVIRSERSSVGINTMSQITMKIATALVDHGTLAATNAG